MKTYFNRINQKELPEGTRKNLQQLVMNHHIEMVFLSREFFCSVPTVIVIVGKTMENTVTEALQRETWITNSLNQHNVIISLQPYPTHGKPVNLPFSAILFNCHTRHLIYAHTEKSWNSLFQNLYSDKQAKNQKLFQQWISPLLTQCAVYEEQFIKNRFPNPPVEVVAAGIKTIYATLFSAFQEFFLARPRHPHFEGVQILTFMEDYISGLVQPLKKISIAAIAEFLNENPLHLTQDRIAEQLTYVAGLKNLLEHHLSNLFHRQMAQTLSWNQYAALYEQPKPTKKIPVPDLPSHVSQIINEHFKTNYIYLHRQNNSGKRTRILLIIVGDQLKISHLQRLQHLLNPHFPEYQFTILLHKAEWLKKHYPLFYGFADRYLHRDYLICQRRAALTFPKKIQQERDFLVRKYWKERKNIIDVHWANIGFGRDAFQDTQLIYLRSIYQHLLLGTLYHYAHYIPNTLNLHYLWDLISFFAPEVSARLVMNRPMKEIIAYVNEPDQNFPGAAPQPPETSTLLFQEAVACCSQLYQNMSNELS